MDALTYISVWGTSEWKELSLFSTSKCMRLRPTMALIFLERPTSALLTVCACGAKHEDVSAIHASQTKGIVLLCTWTCGERHNTVCTCYMIAPEVGVIGFKLSEVTLERDHVVTFCTQHHGSFQRIPCWVSHQTQPRTIIVLSCVRAQPSCMRVCELLLLACIRTCVCVVCASSDSRHSVRSSVAVSDGRPSVDGNSIVRSCTWCWNMCAYMPTENVSTTLLTPHSGHIHSTPKYALIW